MSILIPRIVTPRLFRPRATSWRKCLHTTQVHYRHEASAAGSVQHRADSEQHVNEYAPSLRARKHGFRPLPVSPLMREGYARGTPKQIVQQHDELKEFQKEVAMNPYGKHISRSCFTHDVLTLVQHKH